MPRPRRPFSGQETIEPAADGYGNETVAEKIGTRRQLRWEQSANWRYRSPNGQFDPLSHMLVVDCLAKISPEIELRTAELVKWMNVEYSQVHWDAVTLGKILSDLVDEFTDAMGPENRFIARSRDWKGSFYLLRRSPEALKLLHQLRDDLQRLTRLEIEWQLTQQRSQRLASPLLECPSLRGEFQDVNEEE